MMFCQFTFRYGFSNLLASNLLPPEPDRFSIMEHPVGNAEQGLFVRINQVNPL